MNIGKILAEERMVTVERQIHAPLVPGTERVILCPYCGSDNLPHVPFCCDTLRKAVIAVLMADRMMKNAQAAEKAANN